MLEGIPNNWREDPNVKEVFITCYRMMRLGKKDFDEITSCGFIFDDIDTAIRISQGDIKYPVPKILFRYDEEKEISIPETDSEIIEVNGTIVLFVYAKVKMSQGIENFESIAKKNTDTLIGLLELKFGRNQVFEKMFEIYLELKTGESTVDSDIYLNPDVFPKPHLSKKSFDDFGTTLYKLLIKNKESSRLMLALRIYKKALFESFENKFFDYWLALEVLAMPDKQDNISAIQKRLARIYGLSVDKVIKNDTFLIRKLYTLRKKIIHKGYNFYIHYTVEQYMQALFKDLFYDYIGQESLRLTYEFCCEEKRQQLSKLLSC